MQGTLTADVIIIGAGAAGLGAASVLRKHGVSCVILEARDRVGGRVHSVSLGESWLERGASYIHGHCKNPLVPLVGRNGTRAVPMKWHDMLLKTDYQNIKEDDFSNVLFDMWDRVTRHRTNHIRTGKFVTLLDVVEDYRAKTKLKPTESFALDFFCHSDIEVSCGLPIEELCARHFDHPSYHEGDDLIVLGGYINVITSAGPDANVRLGTPVTKVAQTASRCEVTTAGGETLTCRRVICTLPLGVLKAGAVQFDPPLRSEKRDAIRCMGLSQLNKIFVTFDHVFWENAAIIVLKKQGQSLADLSMIVNIHKERKNKTLSFLIPTRYNIGSKSAEEIKSEVLGVLRLNYPKADLSSARIVSTNWRDDEWARGSYSGYAVGSRPEHVKELGAAEGRVHFAGEHTSLRNLATVHGAWQSGVVAAKQVVDAMNE